MVNHAQDLMSVKKFLDLPNKLIPSDLYHDSWVYFKLQILINK